jgi:hypothetical protein
MFTDNFCLALFEIWNERTDNQILEHYKKACNTGGNLEELIMYYVTNKRADLLPKIKIIKIMK